MSHHAAKLTLVLSLTLTATCRAESPESPRRKVRLTYSAVVQEVPKEARQVRLWLPFPSQSPYQRVSNITINSDVPTSFQRDAEYGNPILFVETTGDAPRPARIELSCDIERVEHVNAAARTAQAPQSRREKSQISKRLLQPDRLVPLDDKIQSLARQVTRGATTDLEKVKAIYEHTVATLTYDKSGTGWGRGDIHYACDIKKGNCTDFHAVFIGLCRASGIPARFEIGFPLPTDRPAGKIAGYHCWAECYVEGYGWFPVDASEAQKHPEQRDYFFGAHDQHRVAFSQGRDVRLAPAQQGEPLNFFIYPYAEVDGKPWEKVERGVEYAAAE
ncbi:MAG: transglutaminase-like domain-containing protein [Planctomycetales bacterium]